MAIGYDVSETASAFSTRRTLKKKKKRTNIRREQPDEVAALMKEINDLEAGGNGTLAPIEEEPTETFLRENLDPTIMI